MHPLTTITVPQGQIAIHWFEQSSYAVKDAAGTIILIDPYFPRERPADRFIHPEPPLDEAELPAHFVLLTHDHSDHTWPDSLNRIGQVSAATRFVGPPESVARILAETTIEAARTTTVQAGDSVILGSISAHAVYAKPPQGDPAANIDPPDVTHLGYILEADGVTLYFTGDPINTFAEHDDLIQAVAAKSPDIGLLTNHPTEGEFPFFEGCVKTAQRIGLKHAVPAHYQCFVKRNYDPQEWAAQFPTDGPSPLIIPHNSHILYGS